MRFIPRLSGLLIAGGPLALLLAVAPLAAPARAITLPPPTGTLRVTYGAASVVAANPAIVITAADNRGNIDSWYQRYGTTTWTFQRVATASGGVSYGSPVVTWAGGNVVIAATDTGGGLDSWYEWPGSGTSWTPDQVATGGYRSPAVAASSTAAVLLTAIGPTGSLDFWSQPVPTTTWSAAQQVAPASKAGSYSAPSIAWASPGIVVTTTVAGQIETWSRAAGSATWTADPAQRRLPERGHHGHAQRRRVRDRGSQPVRHHHGLERAGEPGRVEPAGAGRKRDPASHRGGIRADDKQAGTRTETCGRTTSRAAPCGRRCR